MAKFDSSDDSVVVIIGSGAGGGTLANELCQKGIKVVVLEAGALQSSATFINDEWKSFSQLAWLDPRTTSGTWRVAKDFSGLPAWICKTVGGTTTHWAGASLRLQAYEFKTKTVYGDIKGANLMDWPITLSELEPYYARAEDKMGVTRTNGIPGLPGNNNYKVLHAGATKLGRVAEEPLSDRRRPARLRTGAGLLPLWRAHCDCARRATVPAEGRTRRRADGQRCAGARRRRGSPEHEGRQRAR